jgi:hypothetical protein
VRRSLVYQGCRLASKQPRIDLYRAVQRAEARSISTLGAFTNPQGIEAKYFTETLEDVTTYASKADARFNDGPYRIVKTTIRSDLVTADMRVSVDDGIRTVVLPTELLRHLAAPEMVE